MNYRSQGPTFLSFSVYPSKATDPESRAIYHTAKSANFEQEKKKSLLKEAMDPRGLLDAWSETPEAQPHHQNSRSGRPAGNAPRTRGNTADKLQNLSRTQASARTSVRGLEKPPLTSTPGQHTPQAERRTAPSPLPPVDQNGPTNQARPKSLRSRGNHRGPPPQPLVWAVASPFTGVEDSKEPPRRRLRPADPTRNHRRIIFCTCPYFPTRSAQRVSPLESSTTKRDRSTRRNAKPRGPPYPCLSFRDAKKPSRRSISVQRNPTRNRNQIFHTLSGPFLLGQNAQTRGAVRAHSGTRTAPLARELEPVHQRLSVRDSKALPWRRLRPAGPIKNRN